MGRLAPFNIGAWRNPALTSNYSFRARIGRKLLIERQRSVIDPARRPGASTQPQG